MRALLPARRFRRFVRRQRSPHVARWLRWSQTLRELPPVRPGDELVTVEGDPHAPRAIMVHVSREAIAAPGFPELAASLASALEVDHLTYAYGDAFTRNDSTVSYWCRLCDSNGPGLLVDHYTARHPGEYVPPVDVRPALRVGSV